MYVNTIQIFKEKKSALDGKKKSSKPQKKKKKNGKNGEMREFYLTKSYLKLKRVGKKLFNYKNKENEN